MIPLFSNKIKDSFSYAIQGIFTTFRTERNMRIHTVCTVIVLLSGVILHFKPWEWVAVIGAINFVIVTEMINTAIENTVDLVTLECHPLAKNAKDVAAGAVLFSALCAVIIALIVYWPYLNKLASLLEVI